MTGRFVGEFNPKPSDVTICGSMAHKEQWLKVVEDLRAAGLIVAAPDLSEKTDWSNFSPEEVAKQKGWLIRRHLANIATTKAVLVCNYDKNDTKDSIGSNTFLEMAAAFVYGKPIYVLNTIPAQENREELFALEPIVLNGSLSQLIGDIGRHKVQTDLLSEEKT